MDLFIVQDSSFKKHSQRNENTSAQSSMYIYRIERNRLFRFISFEFAASFIFERRKGFFMKIIFGAVV